jgi:hypothetical protein
MLLLFRNRGGGGLPPDNGFGLLSLTTTQSGVFQAQTATKTGAPLRWWWGDGTFSDGNNPSKVYPDATEKTIYVATTDGWGGLTNFRCTNLNVTTANVVVATALTVLRLSGNQLTTAPDVSANTALTELRLNGNPLTTAPDISNNTALEVFWLYLSQLTTAPDVSNNTALRELWLDNNDLPQTQLDTLVDQCWQNRVALGANNCEIRIGANADPPGATAIAQIDGTGVYAGDGLNDNGCSVTY